MKCGNAPATNLSIILRPESISGLTNIGGAKIVSIGNIFSTTDVILPQYNNTTLEPMSKRTINHSPVIIRIPKLIHGNGSRIDLLALINDTRHHKSDFKLGVYAVYDQGSDHLSLSAYKGSYIETASTLKPSLIQYYVIFFATFGVEIYVYIRRRKTFKRFLTRVVKNILEIRGALNDDLTSKNIFSEVWSEMPEKKRQDHHDIGDYLIIDDFYSKLKKRNSYLSTDIDKEETNLSRANTLSRLNEALLKAAEIALNKIDWNKYR